ncbi:hypothetical protein AB0F91_16640 [Amycolatopsis sp. NPDC023774]|uniref:hypothetical protein n=1 Tax=Amycolatopsis sp. NPDC023774 TaxID=3155015 RepID=UPI0033C796B1
MLTLVNACAWVVSLFPERARADVFGADTQVKIAGALAPTARAERVPGGYRVSGRRPYSSGIAHASWALPRIPVGESGEPAMTLVPATDYGIEHTWAVAGMRGTGSDTVVADEFFVPEHRVVRTAALLERVS